MAHRVTVPHTYRSLGEVSFFECPQCNSLNSTGEFRDFTDFDISNYVWDHYLQLGAGIHFMMKPIENFVFKKEAALLDIGCGFGFTLDYWNFVAQGEAVGLEPSSYGDRGRSELGVNIIPKYLSEAVELKGRRFERIISSEVIEHVPEPREFLREIRAVLSADGIAALTTPNADFVRSGNSLSVMIATLSPGLHRVLFSRKALEDLMRESGFSEIIVRESDDRLLAYGSTRPMSEISSDNNAANYIAYLSDRSARSDPTSSLGIGLRYRLFKELLNRGRFKSARETGHQVVEAVKARYGFDILDPDKSRQAVRDVHSMEEYATRAPYFLPCFLYYAGMAARQGIALGGAPAENLFAASTSLSGEAQTFAAQFFQEAASLYWPSIFEEGFARLINGERKAANALFAKVIEGPDKTGSFEMFCHRDPKLISKAIVQLGVSTLQEGRCEAAMSLFRQVIEMPDEQRALSTGIEAAALWRVASNQATDSLPDWANMSVANVIKSSKMRSLIFRKIISRGFRR